MTILADKTDLIDFVFGRYPVRSFADLGGVWGVNGGYTFHALRSFPVERAVIADSRFTDEVRQGQAAHPQLQLVEGNLATVRVAREVGRVDALLMFDILLHQVLPDWDGFLGLYAPQTDIIVIYNQQYIGGPRSVRLLDLGHEAYLEHVPRTSDATLYRSLFEQMYEIHPTWRWDKRVRRDTPDVWQWGVVDHELIARLDGLGFGLQLFRNYGRAFEIRNFENHGFVFTRREAAYGSRATG